MSREPLYRCFAIPNQLKRIKYLFLEMFYNVIQIEEKGRTQL